MFHARAVHLSNARAYNLSLLIEILTYPSSIPTVGYNLKRVQEGRVTLKCWDLGGQPRFRTMWERYCRGTTAIIFVVDATDRTALPEARDELHALLAHHTLDGIPLLILGNKCDVPDALSNDELIKRLGLDDINRRELTCMLVSAKEERNLDVILKWLVGRASK